jgi:hypothetical protein
MKTKSFIPRNRVQTWAAILVALAAAIASPAFGVTGIMTYNQDNGNIDPPPNGLPFNFPKTPLVLGGSFAAAEKKEFVVTQPPFNAPNNDTGNAAVGIQAALNAAAAANGKVILPGGTYRFTSGISIPEGVIVEGQGWSNSNGVPTTGTWIHVTGTGFTPILVNSFRVQLRSFGIYQDQSTPACANWTPTVYPAAIQLLNSVEGLQIDDLMLLNVYDGIWQHSDANVATGRIEIHRLFGQPLHTGVKFEYCADVIRVSDVHFYPFWNGAATCYSKGNGTAFQLYRLDNPQFNNLFCFGYNALFSLRGNNDGVNHGGVSQLQAMNLQADNSNHLAVISQDQLVGSEWVNVLGGAEGEGNAMFDVEGSLNVLHISNARTLGGQFLKAGMDVNHGGNIIDISNLYADGPPQGYSYPIVQSNATTNEVRISGFHSAVPAHSFIGGVGLVNYTNGNLGPSWIAPQLQNGWGNAAGTQVAGYRRDSDGRIWLRGFISGGQTSAGTVLFNLPQGYRPSASEILPACPSASSFVSIYVDPNGNVTLNTSSGSNISLTGVSFAVD